MGPSRLNSVVKQQFLLFECHTKVLGREPRFLGCLVYESIEVRTVTTTWSCCILKAICQIEWKGVEANYAESSNYAYCHIVFNFVLP
jgi:hypothetical protein